MPVGGKFVFEDFVEGETIEFDDTYEVTRENIIDYAKLYDPQPFHLGNADIPGMPIEGPIASGWHTCAISMQLFSDGYITNSHCVGSPGMSWLKWRTPVLPGDVLHLRRTCREAHGSRSRPEMGVCRFYWEILKPDGTVVMDFEGVQMFLKRATAEAQT